MKHMFGTILVVTTTMAFHLATIYIYINIYIGPAGSDENFLNYFKYDAALPSMDGLELQSITLGLSL
jgi:hypothetical protein